MSDLTPLLFSPTINRPQAASSISSIHPRFDADAPPPAPRCPRKRETREGFRRLIFSLLLSFFPRLLRPRAPQHLLSLCRLRDSQLFEHLFLTDPEPPVRQHRDHLDERLHILMLRHLQFDFRISTLRAD